MFLPQRYTGARRWRCFVKNKWTPRRFKIQRMGVNLFWQRGFITVTLVALLWYFFVSLSSRIVRNKMKCVQNVFKKLVRFRTRCSSSWKPSKSIIYRQQHYFLLVRRYFSESITPFVIRSSLILPDYRRPLSLFESDLRLVVFLGILSDLYSRLVHRILLFISWLILVSPRKLLNHSFNIHHLRYLSVWKLSSVLSFRKYQICSRPF